MIKKLLTSTLLLIGFFLFSLSIPFSVYAETNYGDGSYGTGEYNVGEVTATTDTTTTTTTTSNPSAPECNDTAPSGKEAWLYQGNAENSNSITLRFAHWQTPVSYFAIKYGTEPGEYRFGVDSFGDTHSTSYTVKSLAPNTTYYFQVRTGNGCAPGEWSNELSVRTLGWLATNQIQVEDVTLESGDEEIKEESSSCQSYIVESGDTLWSIAQSILGDGSRYQEIIEQNKAEYPSLESSNSVSAGWELRMDCGEETQDSYDDSKQDGYDVKVKVVDEDKKPVEGAKVTIHSKVQEAITDQDGIAKFSRVEPGDHRVIIAYNDYEGEQALNLTGDVKQFDLNITIATKKTVFSPISLTIIGVLTTTLIAMIVIFLKKKK